MGVMVLLGLFAIDELSVYRMYSIGPEWFTFIFDIEVILDSVFLNTILLSYKFNGSFRNITVALEAAWLYLTIQVHQKGVII